MIPFNDRGKYVPHSKKYTLISSQKLHWWQGMHVWFRYFHCTSGDVLYLKQKKTARKLLLSENKQQNVFSFLVIHSTAEICGKQGFWRKKDALNQKVRLWLLWNIA